MKISVILNFLLVSLLLVACNSKDASSDSAVKVSNESDLYFDFSVDGKPMHIDAADISTSYSEFSPTDITFKIFAGKEDGVQLLLTIPNDMSKPSSTPSGTAEAGAKLFQGSVSLQGYPNKGDTFNNYDGYANPKPEPKADAIIVSDSQKIGDKARIISGTINTITFSPEGAGKGHEISGKFKVKHEFNGSPF